MMAHLFVETYNDGSSVTIVPSREKFIFGSSSGSGRVESNTLVFGCAIDQTHFNFVTTGTNMIAGIMGLAWGESSLISQLRPYGLFRFSYCIPQVVGAAHAPTTFLRFGSDIPLRLGLRATSLVQYGNLNPYFLNLVDMSLGGRRLGMPGNLFVRDEHKHNRGAVRDTGTELSLIISPAFDVLKRALVNHFTHPGSGFSVISRLHGLELCFSGPASVGFNSLPSITFVFREGSGLEVIKATKFVCVGSLGDLGGGHKYVCLAMLRAADITIIGAYQQINQRITYETKAKKLYFGPEICQLHA